MTLHLGDVVRFFPAGKACFSSKEPWPVDDPAGDRVVVEVFQSYNQRFVRVTGDDRMWAQEVWQRR